MEPPDKSALSKELWGTDDYKEIRKILTENDKNAAAEWKKLKNKPVERFTKLKLPYYAPEDSIPQSLPTIRDIEKARATPLCHEFNQFKTYRVNDVFVVKFSATPAVIQEAENLLFLQQHQPLLKVPKLYAAFSHQGGNPLNQIIEPSKLSTFYYVVMEFIPGINMRIRHWEKASKEFKSGMLQKLAQQLRLLRSIPAPEPSYYGRIDYQSWVPPMGMIGSEALTAPLGPFYSKEPFIESMWTRVLHKLLANDPSDSWNPHYELGLRYLKQTLSRFEGWEPKMTHFDIKLDNMVFRPIKPQKWWQPPEIPTDPSELKAEDYEVVLIDWGEACWMPAWVETQAMRGRTPQRDGLWMLEMSKGLEDFYFPELGLVKILKEILGIWIGR